MNCVLFAKMDQVFSKENKTLKTILENWKKILEKSGKSQGILSVRKSGNPVSTLNRVLSSKFQLSIPGNASAQFVHVFRMYTFLYVHMGTSNRSDFIVLDI